MQIVVTGGAGFIGSHIVELLLEEGAAVRVIDHAPDAGVSIPPTAELMSIDIRDEMAVQEAVRGADVVCHQAAKVGLGVSFGDVTDYVSSNDVGTAVLLRTLHRGSFRGRMVLASSMVVYGEGDYTCPNHGPLRPAPRAEAALAAGMFDPLCGLCDSVLVPVSVTEGSQLDPRNVYAATKLHQEHLCGVFGRELKVPVASLRYHNVYGPRMPLDTPYAGVAAIFRSAYRSDAAPAVFEDGHQLRDFVHVWDVARANALCCLRDDPVDGPFNIASGEVRSVLDLAQAMRSARGAAAPAPVVTGEFRTGDVRHIFASGDKAARELGFGPSVSFEEGMRGFFTDVSAGVSSADHPVGGP